MRAQRQPDRETSREGRDRGLPQRPSAPGTAAGLLLALQRSAGNAAVLRAIDEERQQDGQPEQAPRSGVHDVLRSAGRPLDAPVRTEMEARLGADFSDVRVHDDDAAQRSAAEVGARAYTSGSHVVIGESGGDRHTLAHELTHVIQQRQGPVSGIDHGGGLSVSDPSDRFERAAEANATRALARDVGSAPTRPAVEADGVANGAPDGVAVQRSVRVGVEVFSDDPAKRITSPVQSAQALMQRVVAAVQASGDTTLVEQFNANRDEVNAQAAKWVADSQVGTPSSGGHKFGSKRHQHSYGDFEEVGRALLGWVLQKPGRHEEKVFANQLASDPTLAGRVDAVLTKVRAWINQLDNDPSKLHDPSLTLDMQRITDQLASGEGEEHGLSNEKRFGTYRRHFDSLGDPTHHTGFQGDFMSVLNNPGAFDLRDKIIVLHDVHEYFKPHNETRNDPVTAGQGVLPDTPDAAMLESTQQMNPDGTRKVAGADRGARRTTRDENAPSTRMARENRIPVTAGQSFTTARLLHISQEAGATPGELNAVALGVFAFWRIDYDQTVELAAHTLHEVLDIAANFGVPYNMKAPQRGSRDLPGVMAERARRTNEKLAQQIGPLRDAVEDMKGGALKAMRQSGRGKAADALLQQYGQAIAQCETSRRAAEEAAQQQPPQPQQAQQAAADYVAALRNALTIYDQLCNEVKAKRVEDTLTEDDRDAIGASTVPEATV